MYGERQHRRALATTVMLEAYHRIRAVLPPIIDGDGTQVQDDFYAGDVARANLLAMTASASDEGMNIASGDDTSQNEVIDILLRACNSNLAPEHKIDPAKRAMPQQTKQGYSRARAKNLLGWEPQTPITQGIPRLVAWLDRQREA